MTSEGSAVPPNYTMRANRLLFRTEVFAQLDRTRLSRLTSLLSSKTALGFDSARAEAVSSTRQGNTDVFLPTTASTGCFT